MKAFTLMLILVLVPCSPSPAADGIGAKIENLGKTVRKSTERVVGKTSKALKHAGKKTAKGLDTAGTKTSAALHKATKSKPARQ